MGKMVTFMAVLIVLALASFAYRSIYGEKPVVVDTQKELEFKTFTSAVCEDKEGIKHCKDELFVNCNGKISRTSETSECNGITVGNPEITGFAVFGREWKDTRN